MKSNPLKAFYSSKPVLSLLRDTVPAAVAKQIYSVKFNSDALFGGERKDTEPK